jgi:hypothetical protein
MATDQAIHNRDNSRCAPTDLFQEAKFGEVLGLSSGSAETDVWPVGNTSGVQKTFPASSVSFFVSSTSLLDTAVDIDVIYIDDDGDHATATITVENGQTPTDTGLTGKDINRAYESGSVAAVGDLYFTTAANHTSGVPNDDSQVLALIEAEQGQTQQVLITVPGGYYLRFRSISLGVNRDTGLDGSAAVGLFVRPPGKVWRNLRDFHLQTGGVPTIPLNGLGRWPSGTQVRVSVRDVSGNNTNVFCSLDFDLWPGEATAMDDAGAEVRIDGV